MDKLNLVYAYLDKTNYAIDWPNGIKMNDMDGLRSLLLKDRELVGRRAIQNSFWEGDRNGNINIISVNDISNLSKDEKYVFPIEVFDDMRFWSHYLNKDLDIPLRVEQDIIAGKAKLFISVPFEGISQMCYNKLEFLKKIKAKYNNIVYADCNLLAYESLAPEGIKSVFNNAWLNTGFTNIEIFKYIDSLKTLILTKAIRPKKFVCFNRIPKAQRAYIVNRLLELDIVKNNIVTFQLDKDPCKAQKMLKHYEDCYNYKNLDALKKNIPLVYDYDNIFTVNPTHVHINAHKETYFNLVNETEFYEQPSTMFFSEKTFKPIICMQPFVLAGAPNSLKQLKGLGFKTFSDFIDESYDEPVDSTERLERVVRTMQYINSKSFQELSEMLYQMYPILEYNFNHHMMLAEQEIGAKKITREIINNW